MSMKRGIEFSDSLSLRITPRSDLNDPFELIPSKKFIEKAILEIKPEFKENKKILEDILSDNTDFTKYITMNEKPFYEQMGIISFSQRKNNLLQWSHYADEHKGMCIEFSIGGDFDELLSTHEALLLPVIYDTDRYDNDDFGDKYAMEMSCVHKSIEWQYEQEYRITMLLEKCDFVQEKENKIIHLLQFTPTIIKSVYLGCKFDNKEIENVLERFSKINIPVYKAKISDNLYRLEFSRL